MISPATRQRPVVTKVSQATRRSGPAARMASRIESEIWSAILSGWPSVTDSEVKVQLVICSLLWGCALGGVGSMPRPLGDRRRRRGRRRRPPACRSAARRTASPSAPRMSTSLVSCSKPTPGAATSLATMRSSALARAASPRRSRARRAVSAANPTRVCPSDRRGAEVGEDVGGGLELDHRHPVALLDLVRRRRRRAEVGDGGGHDDHVRRRRTRQHRVLHLGGGLDPDHARCRRAPAIDGRRHEGDLGAAGGRLVGEGVALLARRAVADDAHRIDRLAGAAGGDQHPRAGEVPGVRGPARSAQQLAPRRRWRPDRPGGRRRRRRRRGARPPAARRARPATRAWRGCPGRPGAPTSRCASPGRPSPAPGWRAGVAVSRSSEKPAA